MLSLLIQEFVTFFIILYISLMFLPCINKSDDDGDGGDGKKTCSAQGIKLRGGGGGGQGKYDTCL